MKKFTLLILMLSCLTLSACSTVNSVIDTGISVADSAYDTVTSQETFSFDTQNGAAFQLSNRVVRGNQLVTLHPNINLESPPTALFVPMGITQDTLNPHRISQGISQIIWQQFLQVQTFSVLEYARMNPPHRVEDALYTARQKGAEFLVGGYITYFFDGGTNADTQMSIIIEVYDVANGNLLWSIAHAGLLPYEVTRDFVFFKVDTAMPFDPTYTVASTLGMDIARLIKMWTDPNYSENTRENLFTDEPKSF